MSLYLNVWDYIEPGFNFNLFISSRGRGKTYSALDGAIQRTDENNRFMLMRRTADEHEMLLDKNGKEGLNPFKSINKNTNNNLACKAIAKKLGGIYHREVKDNQFEYTSQIGYTSALSNFAGVRGLDLADCKYMIYDEFIPEAHIKAIKAEGEAFLQAYETINRNREFDGEPPLLAILLANSNNIYNPIMKDLGLVNIAEKMMLKGQEHYYNKKRGLAMHIFQGTDEFTKKKENTALYRLSAGSDFSKMALNNDFVYNDFSNCKFMSTKGMRPICALDEAYIYQSNKFVYISYAKAQCLKFSSKNGAELRQFMRTIGLQLIEIYTSGRLWSEDYNLKKKILDIIL